MSINRVVLTGRLTKDVELRATPSGANVASFTVAVDGFGRDQNNNPVNQASFINCVAWRQTAEFVSRYFQKGSMIAVQGSIQTGSYEKDGIKRRTFEIVADNVSFCGSKSESGNTAPRNDFDSAPSFSNGNVDDFSASADDDELPF